MFKNYLTAKNTMRPLTNREQKFLFLTFTLALICFFYFFIWKSFRARLEDLNTAAQKENRRLRWNLQIIEESNSVSKKYKNYLEFFLQHNSAEEQMSAIISDLEAIAQKKNLHFSEIKPAKVKNAKFYNIFSISLTMDGNFSQITEFIYAIQNQPYFFSIDELHLEKKSPEDIILQMRMVLSRKLMPERKEKNR